MSRRGWQHLPEYQFRNDNPNPKMRPNIDSLVSKLRKMSFLQNDPAAVEFVVNDLIGWYLVREAPRPDSLYRVASMTLFRFFGLAHGDLAIMSQTGLSHIREKEIYEAGRLAGFELGLAQAPEPVAEPQIDIGQFLTEHREAAELVVANHFPHYYATGETRCSCGRFTGPKEEWARHLRIRIWKRLRNDFSPAQEPVEASSAEPAP